MSEGELAVVSVYNRVGGTVRTTVRRLVSISVNGSVGNSVWEATNEVYNEVWNTIYASVCKPIRDSVHAQTYISNAVCDLIKNSNNSTSYSAELNRI